MSKEAFVYLWYDAPNDMYYLGKHKGSPDDKYTHSSSIWESFTKDNIPEGVTREILAEGTHEEMCVLEHELLVEAKNGGDWDRYYNNSLGDPRYVDTSGENSWNWKGGITYDMKEYMKKYDQSPRKKEYNKKRQQTPEYKAYMKEYYQTPEYKEKQKKRNQTPDYKAHRLSYDKKRNQTPERKAYMREWKRKDYAKKKAETGFAIGYSQAKKKTEKQGAGSLDAFLK